MRNRLDPKGSSKLTTAAPIKRDQQMLAMSARRCSRSTYTYIFDSSATRKAMPSMAAAGFDFFSATMLTPDCVS